VSDKQWDDTNRGVMFDNDKADNPNRPDYRGTLNVDGTEYRISAWHKKSKGGVPFISMSVQPKTESGQYNQQERRPIPAVNQPVDTAFNDDVPF
jgi:hypothetical protein